MGIHCALVSEFAWGLCIRGQRRQAPGSLYGGANISQKPYSTIGFERRFNDYLRFEDKGEFVRTLTSEQTPQPPNFDRIVELNRDPLLAEASPLEPLLPERVKQLAEAGPSLSTVATSGSSTPHTFRARST